MDLKGVEIFKAGEWKGIPFTERDLDDMAANFAELAKAGHRVPLKLGHSGDRDTPKGMPALGWVAAVRRAGSKLLADFTNVPAKIYEAIRQKRYRTVSVELLMGAKLGERTFGHVLDAVALLGAEQPAVLGLGDLDQYLASRDAAFDDAGRMLAFEAEIGIEVTDDAAKLAQLEEQLAAERSRAAEAERKAAKLEADRRTFEREQQKIRADAVRKQLGDALEDAVRKRLMLPAQRDMLARLFAFADDAAALAFDVEAFTRTLDVKLPEQQAVGLHRSEAAGGGIKRVRVA